MRIVLLIILICFSLYSSAQHHFDSALTQNDITLGYYNEITNYYYKVSRKNMRQLCFFDKFDDSISVYLNDRLITSKWFKLDSFSKLTIVLLKKIDNDKFNFVRVVMHKSRIFIEFPLDKRYYFVELHYRRNENEFDFWNIVFTNNVPHRD